MDEQQHRMIILEHRMDTAEEQNRYLNEELVRSRLEVRDAIARLDQRIDRLSERMETRADQLTQNILELSTEIRKTHRWMIGLAVSVTSIIVLLLPISWKLADRFF